MLENSRNLVKNCRPISLFPIFKYQSGFLPGDSCISQLLSIVHVMNSSFDWDPTQDDGGVFLDISKAFEKVWH